MIGPSSGLGESSPLQAIQDTLGEFVRQSSEWEQAMDELFDELAVKIGLLQQADRWRRTSSADEHRDFGNGAA